MVNKVILIGRLGTDPEIKVLEKGKRVLNLVIATTEYFKKNGQDFSEETTWHSVSFWGSLIMDRIEKNLKKGDTVFIEGKIKKYVYEDDKGIKSSRFVINGDSYKLIKKYRKKNVED